MLPTFFSITLVNLYFIEFPVPSLTRKCGNQIRNLTHAHNLHEEKEEIFIGDFARENLAAPGFEPATF